MKKKVLLLILDGFGIAVPGSRNAISSAKTPNYNEFSRNFSTCTLDSSGTAVGLPEGTMGNSEVGHLNIGAGRIVYQMNAHIDSLIADGNFFTNEALQGAADHVRKKNGRLHLFGLVSDGNVHSYHKHLYALLDFCKRQKLDKVYLHAFLDGRDTSPEGGLGYIKDFMTESDKIGVGRIATICGRYYAMDRDKRWDRVQTAYDAIVNGKGEYYHDPLKAIQESYEKGITDEFLLPKIFPDHKGDPVTVRNGDCIIFFNFRADRARQITNAFVRSDFIEFPVHRFTDLKFVCFAEYESDLREKTDVCFQLPPLVNILGEVIARSGLRQLRLAETEKYAHVTFFFNGGKEEPFPGEDRILVPSPRIATYDLQPEMSAFEVKDKLVNNIRNQNYALIITNFANCDMVGHTGNFPAAVKAVEVVDDCLGEIIPVAGDCGYQVIITADHGNAETMLDEKGKPFTAHTRSRVPFLLNFTGKNKIALREGILADIAPTILKMMNVEKPPEMTGNSLF